MPIFINDVNVECINHAARSYKVPAAIILSVIKKEGGRNGDAIKNKSNGTIDYGVMQINSVWLSKIAAYGYSKHDIQYDACKNILVGTWIIAQNMASSSSLWTGVANYHSRTPVHHMPYKMSIYHNYNVLVNSIR